MNVQTEAAGEWSTFSIDRVAEWLRAGRSGMFGDDLATAATTARRHRHRARIQSRFIFVHDSLILAS